jgi:HTH-type transcriptional regulator/antitoxin HigA
MEPDGEGLKPQTLSTTLGIPALKGWANEKSEMLIMTKTRRDAEPSIPYLALIQRFPLRPIRSDEEPDQAIEVIDELTDREDLDQSEKDNLDVLSGLIERYEAAAYPIGPVSDADVLAHLIEARGITQAALAHEAEVAESTISEILAGKRFLYRLQIARLARYFNVGPTVFRFTV